MKVAQNMAELIGNTPIMKLNKISQQCGANIFGKCEFLNPNSSIKDRIALSMIKDGLESGRIQSDTTIIEPTSGNTGVGLAGVCASMGLKLIITMPESMSLERRIVMKAFGAKLELTPASKGMKGAVERADELHKEIPNSVILQQFQNPANPMIHKVTTGQEILKSFEGEKIDVFLAGVGTGGSITGIGEALKEVYPDIHIVAIEPKDSPVLSGGNPSPHKIQGIGAGFVPDVLNTKIYNRVLQVANEDAFETAQVITIQEGLLVGISSGANIFGAMSVAKEFPGKNILTMLNDTGERYLSTELFQ